MAVNGVASGNDVAEVLAELRELGADITRQSAHRLSPFGMRYPRGFPAGVRNLADYLALRNYDLQPLLQYLAKSNIPPLACDISQVRAHLAYTISMLGGISRELSTSSGSVHGRQSLKTTADTLFGKCHSNRHIRIIATLPPETATSPETATHLLEKGADCARIDCAQGNPASWLKMINHVRTAQSVTGKQVRIFMDLAGHSIRTGTIAPGPAVMHLKVSRDAYGRETRPARVYLGSGEIPEHTGQQYLPIEAKLSRQLQPGCTLYFRDTRNKHRTLKIKGQSVTGDWLAECHSGAYIQPGTRLSWKRPAKKHTSVTSGEFVIGEFSGNPQVIRLYRGDHLLLGNDGRPGCAGARSRGKARPAYISCSHPGVVDSLNPGDSIWMDTGRLGLVMEKKCRSGALLKVTHAGPKGARVRSGSRIHLPDTELPLPALSRQDLADLDFACRHADMIGCSFVRKLSDLDVLRHELAARGRPDMAIVLRIDTAAAARNLPDLLLGCAGQQPIITMIAREELAVELDSVRMAGFQEEILWICRSSCVPVIFTSRALDTLAHKGVLSRPELTEAATNIRGDCVLLGNGDYMIDAVAVLDDVLVRMDAQHYLQESSLRQLNW